ncbi:MAG: D-alanyl-D-alanine carboxypeptidase family protein [Candidatus Saccharibacteria bacterium]
MSSYKVHSESQWPALDIKPKVIVPVRPNKTPQDRWAQDKDLPVDPKTVKPSAEPVADVSPTQSKTVLVDNPNDILVLVNKTHLLPSNYVPDDLVIPSVPFASTEPDSLRNEAALALEQLFNAAKQSGIKYYCLSGYRSYIEQKKVYSDHVYERGEYEANQVSARPGRSEHQTGLAADLTSDTAGRKLVRTFGRLKEGLWLKTHAHEFGFVIRYPLNKETITGYYYEPWHVRYVGTNAAAEIYDKNIVLEEYIANINVN